jgi:FtsZ-binding cell division protein ZapB
MFVPIPFAGMVEIDMDTNDLADRLEQFYSGTHIQKAAETLRQQQTEIDKLQEENIELQRLFDKAMDEWSKSK